MREPTILRPRVAPDADAMRRLEERIKSVVPPDGALLIRDQPPVRKVEQPLSMLLRRQAG